MQWEPSVPRDMVRLEAYLTRLTQDIYPQPSDPAHRLWCANAVRTLCTIPQGARNVLDIGCGDGHAAADFASLGIEYTGVTLGAEAADCRARGLNVVRADFSFLSMFGDDSFDLLFARYALEHSPMPVVTLMEWRRVCRGHLALVAPAPGYWGYRGRNHYAVMGLEQLDWLLARAGWNPIFRAVMHVGDAEFREGMEASVGSVPAFAPEVEVEYRLLCERCREIDE